MSPLYGRDVACSRMRKRASGVTLGALAAVGIALAVSPLWKRLRAAIPFVSLHSHNHPPNDHELAAELRSRLDSVTDELRLAPVEVTVTDNVVTVHGDVRSSVEAGVIDDAASAVPGVAGVISHLAEFEVDDRSKVGPESESPEFYELLAAARAAGCTEPSAGTAVRTVLSIFLEHLPIAERTGILIHLPPDVRRIAISPRRSGAAVGMLPNTIDALVEAVSHVVALPRDTAHEVVVAVLQTLNAVLPEDFREIQAKLPVELANLWTVTRVPSKSIPGSD